MRSSTRSGSRRESFASTLRRASARAVDEEASGWNHDGDGLESPLIPPGDGEENEEARRRAEEGAAEVQSRNTWIKHIR